MASILRQRDLLFSSVPEGRGLTLALVINSVLVLVIVGIAAGLVYRRWKRNRTMSGNNPPDEEVPMDPVTVQPAAETVLTYQSDYSVNLNRGKTKTKTKVIV